MEVRGADNGVEEEEEPRTGGTLHRDQETSSDSQNLVYKTHVKSSPSWMSTGLNQHVLDLTSLN